MVNCGASPFCNPRSRTSNPSRAHVGRHGTPHRPRARAVRRYSSMSSTMRWPRTRSCSQPRASAGSRLRSGDDVVVLDEGFELDEEVAVFLVVAGFLIILSGEAPDCVE